MEKIENSYQEKFEESNKLEEKSEYKEAELKQDLIDKYSLFKKMFKPKDDVIYHPCGANDVTPSVVFPYSRVIYVDIDKKSVNAIKNCGFEAHAISALEYNPGAVDILIMISPNISPEIPISYVVNNGFVLSNDYHGTASSLRRNEQFQLRAVIISKDGELILDKENLDDYWNEIDTDEKFKDVPFNYGAADYEMAVIVVNEVTGKKENVLAEYKKIITKAREEIKQNNSQLKLEPEVIELIKNEEKEAFVTLNHNGRQFVLLTTIPKKKGNVDDIFVFQKRVIEKT